MEKTMAIFEKEMEISNLEFNMIMGLTPTVMTEGVSDLVDKAIKKLQEMIQKIVDFVKNLVKKQKNII